MSGMFPNLFSPITIRGKTFKNRILLAPKGIPLSDGNKNHMAQDALGFYERIARGGAARIVTAECDVQYGSAVYGTYNMFLDPLPEELKRSVQKYVENCHKYACLAGHRVTLFEKSDSLGGVLRYTDNERFKPDIRRYYHAVVSRVQKMDIDIRLGEEAAPDTVKAMKPDIILLAVGAAQKSLEIPISADAHLMDCVSCYREPEKVGDPIVILGGGLTACEAAIHFADQGKRVSVVSHADRLMNRVKMVGPANGSTDAQLILLDKLGVSIYTNCEAVRLNTGSVTIRSKEGTEDDLPAETVINGIGLEARPEAAEAYFECSVPVIPIGDCLRPANIGDAVAAAYQAVLTIDE